MRALRPSELRAIIPELQRQMEMEQKGKQNVAWAMLSALSAVITNNISRVVGMFSKRKPKVVTAADFMPKEETNRKGPANEGGPQDWSKHIEDAKAKGLVGPW